MLGPVGTPYNRAFYRRHVADSAQSADVIVPIVLEAVRPRQVVDVGCGVGAWLAAFRDRGVDRILGLDGDHVPRDRLMISADDFRSFDLAKPVGLDQRFDLAISLEVAEHLPEASAADFVASLTRLSDIVLFSAAIPGQGGDGHVNEQWQSYWAALFATHGYRPIDCIRPRVWRDPRVQWWYMQNILLYVSADALERAPLLREMQQACAPIPLDLVHPRRYLLDRNSTEISVRRAGRLFSGALRRWAVQRGMR
jgi:SAM-dependent methyltransferase